jgi:2-oxoglutarate ferredoxin oxidoreductase subunit delta
MERFYQGDFYLAIERAFCKGCALCVKSCPVDILGLDVKGKISVKVIDKCVFCGLCEARCPDFAIWIVKSSAGKSQTEGERVKQA